MTAAYRPRYPGAPKQGFRGTPAFYFRYGRFTITNASGFAPRRGEDVVRGLGVEVVQSERVGVSLSARYDTGRRESSSPAYAGLGSIRATLRARLALSYDLRGPWRLGASWNADAAGRGNGGVGDISGGWDRQLDSRTTLSLGSSLSFGDVKYMQAYYGITDAQAARSIYPAYRAGAGLRDIGISAGLRRDFAQDWVALLGAGATRLLGSAATSPITRERNGWGVNAGLGWRF
jgi:outer membrane scaffolding protein for murein synthesis (MipA/OmpV family)